MLILHKFRSKLPRFVIIMVPIISYWQDHLLGGQFCSMCMFNLLCEQNNLLGGRMPIQLTCYLPPCYYSNACNHSFLYFQDTLAGVVVVSSKSDVQHQGITLVMDGSVNLQLSSKSVGLFEAFYNSLKVGFFQD